MAKLPRELPGRLDHASAMAAPGERTVVRPCRRLKSSMSRERSGARSSRRDVAVGASPGARRGEYTCVRRLAAPW